VPDYNNALQEGHGAYLLEQDEKSQDNFMVLYLYQKNVKLRLHMLLN